MGKTKKISEAEFKAFKELLEKGEVRGLVGEELKLKEGIRLKTPRITVSKIKGTKLSELKISTKELKQ